MKSEPMKVTYSESSLTRRRRSDERPPESSAALISRRTGSQPVSTTGENMITSTFCAMNAAAP